MPKVAELSAPGVYTRAVMGGYRAGNPAELIRK
jgi:adenylylsulfate reductase subunit B